MPLTISINAGSSPLLTATAGDLITLGATGAPGGVVWAWQFLDVPEGSAAALSDSASHTPTFTADIAGSYLIMLTVDPGGGQQTQARALVSVKQTNGAERIPAVGEKDDAGALGWGLALKRWLKKLDALRGTPPTPSPIGSSGSIGSSAQAARADHVHGHGAQTDGSMHAAAVASGASGFLTGSDKAKLDGVAASATNTPLASSAPGTIGSSSATGSGTSAARNDHTHAHGAQTDGSMHAAAVASGASGFLTGSDKAKLDGVAAGATKSYAQWAAMRNAEAAPSDSGFMVLGRARAALTIAAMYLGPGGALTANNTSYATISLYRSRSGSNTLIGSLTTKTTSSGGSGDWDGSTTFSITVSSGVSIIAGDIIIAEIAKSGSGVTLPLFGLFVDVDF